MQFEVHATDFTKREIVEREESAGSLLFEAQEYAKLELENGFITTQMESNRVGSIIGAVDMLMFLDKSPEEILTIGRAYVVKRVVQQIEDIQILRWNLDHIISQVEDIFDEMGRSMHDEDARCVMFVEQILESLINEFGENPPKENESCPESPEPKAHCQSCSCNPAPEENTQA